MSNKILTPQQVKRKQILTVSLVAMALLVIVWAGLAMSDKKTGQDKLVNKTETEVEVTKRFSTPSTQIRKEDQWMAEGGKKVDQTALEVETTKKQLTELQAQLEALKKGGLPAPGTNGGASPADAKGGSSPAAISLLSKALPPPPAAPAPIPPPPVGMPVSNPTMPLTPTGQPMKPADEFQQLDLTDGSPENKQAAVADEKGPKSKAVVKSVNTFVPAGSFAKVVLLGGVDAPTGGQAANMALPVVMRVKSFFKLPNYYQANLKECYITGNAYGDLSSERAFIRTGKMSCVLKNGTVLEVDVKGHLNGEDGSFGMRGKLVEKQGQLLAKSFFAGLFSGLGNSIAQQNQTVSTTALGTVTTIDPNKAAQSGLATGASTAMNKIADFYLNQAQTIFPVIEISAGRVGEVYLMEGADFGSSLIKADIAAAGEN